MSRKILFYLDTYVFSYVDKAINLRYPHQIILFYMPKNIKVIELLSQLMKHKTDNLSYLSTQKAYLLMKG